MWFLTLLAFGAPAVHALTSYANDFIDPAYVVGKVWNATTNEAQETIVDWAIALAAQGPWTVTNKSVVPPTGDKHTYMSWAPYSWPNCTAAGNTTALTDEEVWKTCPYYTRDGLFNPDVRFVNDTGAFTAMSDAVLYNALAWAITDNATFATNVAHFIETWFVSADTRMLPNLDYAQMQRGPAGQNGSHTGVLDLKCMSKIVSAVLALREGKAQGWTNGIDAALVAWTKEYIQWLTTAGIALEEKAATNNHGTFYYNQLAALQVLVDDKEGALATLEEYFSGIYKNQISANGEQPLEAIRTRPYHYRAYNLAAMITNARIAAYLTSPTSYWDYKTTNGSTIKDALDFALTIDPGSEVAAELYPSLAAVGAEYGDADGSYAKFLAAADEGYVTYPYFFWDQTFSDSGLVKVTGSKTGSKTTAMSGASGVRGAAVAVLGAAAAAWTLM